MDMFGGGHINVALLQYESKEESHTSLLLHDRLSDKAGMREPTIPVFE